MRPLLALGTVALGLGLACTQMPSVQVAGPQARRFQVGDRVQFPLGTITSVAPSGLVKVHVRIRPTGDVAVDLVELECDPSVLRLARP